MIPFNPVPENFEKGKILDSFLRDLLAEQDKYIFFKRRQIFQYFATKNCFCVWVSYKSLG